MAASPTRWIVAQEGSRQSYAVPVAFHRLNLLRLLYVDTWCPWGRPMLKHGPKGLRAWSTHFAPGMPPELVVSFNTSFLVSRALFHYRKNSLSPESLADEYCRFGEKFAGLVRDRLRSIELSPEHDFFFGFNTNVLETLQYLKPQGVFTVVDQVDPGKIEEDLCVEEAERWPGWSKVPVRMPESYWDRLRAEWAIADLVLVNSEWSAHALLKQGVPRDKLIIVPLALDVTREHADEPVKAEGTLRILWLGSIILRKGIQYLIEAARLLRGQNVEFHLAGPIGLSDKALRSFPSNVKVLGRITRDQLSAVYQQSHLFVLPTISDGFAVTQLEAMAHGLPVITTHNCGRVVTDGLDGLIVPARDSRRLAEALESLNNDRHRLRAMSAQALQTVRKYDLPSNARMIHQLTLEYRDSMRTGCVALAPNE